MSKGVSIRDSASILSFALGLNHSSANSLFEVAPLDRMMCMGMSISRECFETEIIMYRVIRGWKMTEYVGREICTNNRHTPQGCIIAATFEQFTVFMVNKSGNLDGQGIYTYTVCDQEWVAVRCGQNM